MRSVFVCALEFIMEIPRKNDEFLDLLHFKNFIQCSYLNNQKQIHCREVVKSVSSYIKLWKTSLLVQVYQRQPQKSLIGTFFNIFIKKLCNLR